VNLQAVDQLNRAVMLDLQSFREHSDCCLSRLRQALNRQQRLMLLRLDPGGTGSLFAEIQKTPDLIAKVRQRLIIETIMRAYSQGLIEIIS
jgi:hypothetical protein